MMPATAPLWGRTSIHVGHWSSIAGALVCVMCKVSLDLAAQYECDPCPGWTDSAPAGAALPAPPDAQDPLPFLTERKAA